MAKKQKKKVVSGTGRHTKAGFVSADFEAPDIPDYVVVELRYESPVAFSTVQVRRAGRRRGAGRDAEQRAGEVRHPTPCARSSVCRLGRQEAGLR